jgi:GTP-binding protein HflX
MRALLVSLGEIELEDVRTLSASLGYEVVGEITQDGNPKPKYLIGSGKAKEVASLADEQDVDIVVFNNNLSPSQVGSLEALIGCDVIDRFDLILNVFDQHTSSLEAKLQVELVRLKRNLPFIKRALGRRVKAEHPGYGGSGEFIINSTMAGIRKRIKNIEKKLEEMDRRVGRRDLKRRERFGLRTVSLAGYTNSGKSTLFNRLTRGSQAASDAPFTTLQSKMGSTFLDGEKVLVVDTIGFIEDLPHSLISAFRATLSSIRNSDLILLVCDISDQKATEKMRVCRTVLEEIGAGDLPRINVLNKADKLDGYNAMEGIMISAEYGYGIDALRGIISEKLHRSSSQQP